jgi:hypothetical protein
VLQLGHVLFRSPFLGEIPGQHELRPRRATLDVVRRAFEKAGVEFIDENGGGPSLRLRKSAKQRR